MNNQRIARELLAVARDLTAPHSRGTDSMARNLSSGAGPLPEDDKDVFRLVDAVNRMANGEWSIGENGDPQDLFMDVFNDDGHWDEIREAERDYLKRVAAETKKAIREMIRHGDRPFKDVADYKRLVSVANMLGIDTAVG